MTDLSLPQDFSDFLKLLIAKGARFLLIGGYAVTYHGYPRYTGDLDIFIDTSEENAQKLVEVVLEFGFDTPKLKASLFTTPGKVVRMGQEPLRIEVLNQIDGVTFDEAFSARITAVIEGIEVPIIGLETLKKNKAAAGRAKDLADPENLP